MQSDVRARFVPVRIAYSNPIANRIMISTEQGATPIIDLATREPREEINGVFFMRHKAERPREPAGRRQQLSVDLWDQSAELVGL